MKNEEKIPEATPTKTHTNRRGFLKISGLTLAGTGLLLAGCNNDDEGTPSVPINNFPGVKNGTFDLGGGDFGILTYAYALEQLEAAFYTEVISNNVRFALAFPLPSERTLMTDIYNHEVIHREFFRTALTAALPNSSAQLLPDLSFDFSSVDFTSRTSILGIAKILEDTGVAAYNGAGRYLSDGGYLLLAGKIVSVEARHASAIRSLINPNSNDFAGDDVVNSMTGLDVVKNPSEVLNAVGETGFITTPFTAYFLA